MTFSTLNLAHVQHCVGEKERHRENLSTVVIFEIFS